MLCGGRVMGGCGGGGVRAHGKIEGASQRVMVLAHCVLLQFLFCFNCASGSAEPLKGTGLQGLSLKVQAQVSTAWAFKGCWALACAVQ